MITTISKQEAIQIINSLPEDVICTGINATYGTKVLYRTQIEAITEEHQEIKTLIIKFEKL